MAFLYKMRQQKLLSITLMIFTLSVGIVIGTLINTGVFAAKDQMVAPDATPKTLSQAVQTVIADARFRMAAQRLATSAASVGNGELAADLVEAGAFIGRG